MHRYRLLTSNDYDHFYVKFNNYDSYKDLCLGLKEETSSFLICTN